MANERQIAPTSEGAKGPTDFQQLLRLRAEVDKPGAPPQAVASLRRFLAEHPKLLDEVEIMAATTRSALVNKISDQLGLRVVVEAELKGIRRPPRLQPRGERGGAAADRANLPRLAQTAMDRAPSVGASDERGRDDPGLHVLGEAAGAAQKRFTRAIESLAKVRKLTERKSNAKASVAMIEAAMRESAVQGMRQAQYDAAGRALAGRFGAQE